MSNRSMTASRPTTTVPSHDTTRPWSAAARFLASLAILVYLAAVTLPPLAGPPPASELARRLMQPLRPLVGALSLGHGYRFFAPDPGPGHTIRWTLQMADGSERSGSIPDRDTDWPRLLYHRRFMVAEKIASLVPPLDAPEGVRFAARQDWQPLIKGVAGNLLAAHDGVQVRLEMVEHFLPGPEDIVQNRSEPDIVTPLGTYARLKGRAR
jgi:hypothetical protein